MQKIIAKRVSLLELFYDLIFVYAISKITAMIHHPVAGGIPLFNYIEFVFVVIMVMQIWLYQALYINRFGKSRIIDTIGLLISMYAMTYLANNINTEWSVIFRTFNSAVVLIVAGLIWQYLCGSGKHPMRDHDVRAFAVTLILELIAVLSGLLIGYHYGIFLCVLGGLIGFLMPLAVYQQFVPKNVNFPHLVERLGLIIIITFGESLVNITRYFNGSIIQLFPALIFVLLVTMFGAYIIQDELLINHHQRSRGFVLMYSHVFMVISLLSMTAGLDYLAESGVSRLNLWLLLSISILGYYLCLVAKGVYNHRDVKLQLTDYCVMLLIFLISAGISFYGMQSNCGLMIGFALCGISEFLWLLKISRVRK